MIYLDNAATTPVKPEVMQTIMETMRDFYGNPSSIYNYGFESQKILSDSRKKIADKLNCEPEEIIFTSGACEANSLAINSIIENNRNKSKYSVIYSTPIEHKSIHMQKELTICDVDNEGKVIDILINPLLSESMSIQYANNEIGTIQDIKGMVAKYKKEDKNFIVHTDATQMIANSPIDVKDLDVDMLSLSGQKIGAPKGIGILFHKKGYKIHPLIYGSQEFGLRGGTENLPYIAGLAKAFELLDYNKVKDIRELRNYCYKNLINRIPDIHLNGSPDLTGTYRLSNNLNITIPNVNAEELIIALGLKDICIANGSACNSGSKEPSYVLKAIGLTDEQAFSTIRITFGEQNTREEVDEFIDTIVGLVAILRKKGK